jgi:hypothetical protein
MGQRSPRLVFRDPDIPGTIHASSPYYNQQAANSLQDLATDVPRGMVLFLHELDVHETTMPCTEIDFYLY